MIPFFFRNWCFLQGQGVIGALEEIILNEQKDYKRGRSELKNSLRSLPAQKQNPGVQAGVGVGITRTYYPRMRRRTRPARPIRPLPNRVMVPGSGTTVPGPVDANPVCSPQPVPDAVQKCTTTFVN